MHGSSQVGGLINPRFGRLNVIGSEGGHIGIDVSSPEQYEYEQFIRKKRGLTTEGLSAEWCFCGKAIPLLYEFLAEKKGVPIPQWRLNDEPVFTKIETDEIAKEAFEHFLRLLGTVLSHLAACFVPDDGIVLCQTIVSSCSKYIIKDSEDPEKSILLKAIRSNKCIGSYLSTIPVYLTTEDNLGMKGCFNLLRHLQPESREYKD